MPNKQVIETNKLKIGSSGATGLYVGNVESKYAVMTDSARTQTVVYDKVTYNFGVTDLSGTVPASGGTYNIAASTSTRTHGNGTVDQVSYSPTSVTVPANTGSSYSSSVTVTQASSNLTDAYNFTVAGDAVKSIALTISNPSTIPASGGSVSTCTTAATVTYNSGRVVTSFTPTSVNFNTVTASSKGTTISDITTAGTLTCYIIYGGVTSNTASVYVKQAANAVVSYTGYSDLTGKSISASKVSAAGGTSTITWSGTPSAKRKPVYTSTATGSSVSYTPTISTAVTGNNAVASKGSTISNETTAIATVTGYYWANGLTASTTTSVKQNANYVTMVEATGSSSTSHFKYNNISAGATTSSIVGTGAAYYTFTSGSRVLDSNSSPSFGGTASYSRSNFSLASSQNGFTAVNANNGTLTATSLGTTISNARTSAVVTGRLVVTYTHASGYSGGTVTSAAFDSTATCTQNGNYVTGISVAGQGVSITNIPASGGSKTPSGSNGTVTYTFSSTSTSTTAPASTYGALTSSVSYAMTATGRFTLNSTSTGEVNATTKGTTIENVTNANTLTKTVNYTWTPTSSYNAAGTKTCSGTATCTPKQDGNYVTGMTVAGVSLSYAAIPAGGGSKTPTGSDGTVTYAFSSTSTSTSAPASTYGTQTKDVSYTMTASGRFTLKSASTGEVSATTKGTSVEGVTSSNTVTKTVTYTWTPSSSYSAAGTKTASGTATNKATQAANAVTSYTDYQTPTGKSISGSQVPAAGGTSTITWSGTAAQNAKAVYTSTSTASTYTNVAPSVSTAITGNSQVGSKGTTTSNVTTALTVTGYYWANGKTASTSCYVTQAANAVVSYTDYQTPTGKSISGSQVPAAGGTSTITWSGTAAQNAKAVYTSTSTASTYTNVAPSVSTAITGNSQVGSKGTTTSNVTTALTVTGYYWANGKTASTSCYVTQAANAVVSYTDYQTPTGKSISGSQVGAGGGTSTITWSGTAAQQAKAVYTSNSTASTYTTLNPTVSTAITGNSQVGSKGTTISNVTTALTVTGYYWANNKTASTTCYVTQAGNYVSSLEFTTNPTLSYATTISAAGGSCAQSGGNGAIKYIFTSTSSANTAPVPASTYGSVSTTRDTYTMTNGNGFSLNTSNGTVTAESRSTTPGAARSSNQVSVTVKYTWTPTSSYPGGTKTVSKTATATATQEANAVTASGLTNITISTPTGNLGQIAASGGKKTFTTKTAVGGVAWSGYTANATATTQQTVTWAYNKADKASLGNKFYFINNTTDGVGISAATWGTTTSNATTSQEVTIYAYVNNVNGQSKTGSTTFYATQAANTATWHNEGYSGRTASLTIASNSIHASGGSATFTTGTTRIPYGYYTYTSGGRVPTSGNQAATTQNNQDACTLTLTTNGNNRFNLNGLTLTHTNMAKSSATDTWKVTATNANDSSATSYKEGSVTNSYSDSWNGVSCSAFSYSGTLPASGGTSSAPSITYSTSQSGTRTWTSTATEALSNTPSVSYAKVSGDGFSVNSSDGKVTANNRTTTTGDARTCTVRVTVFGTGNKTATKDATISQEANVVTNTSYGSVSITSPSNNASLGSIAVGGGSKVPTRTASQTITYTFTSNSTSSYTKTSGFSWSTDKTNGSALGTGFYAINDSSSVPCGISAATRNNVPGAQRTSSTLTLKCVGENSVSASVSYWAVQVANSVTNTEYGTVTVNSPSGSLGEISAAGGSKTPTLTASQPITYTLTLGTSSSTNNSFTWAFNKSANAALGTGFYFKNESTGEITAVSRTTVVGDARTSSSVTVYAYANDQTGSSTYYVTQAANAVTSSGLTTMSVTSPSGSIGTIGAGGGYKNPTLTVSGGEAWTGYTSGSSGTTTPTRTWTFSKTANASLGTGFYFKNASTGQISAVSRTTVVGDARTSNNVGATATSTANGVTRTASTTYYAAQAANAVTGSGLTSISVTSPSYSIGTIPAGGGATSPTLTATGGEAWTGYTSGSYDTTTPNKTWVFNKTANAALGTGFYFKNASTGQISADSRTTATGNSRTSYEVTAYAYVNNVNGESRTGSSTYYATQAANAVTGSGLTNISITSPSGSLGEISAAGGSKTPTLTATGGEAWTGYTSGSSGTSTPNKTWVFNKSANAALGTGFYFKNATTGEITAVSRTTATGNSRTSNSVTVYAYVNSVNGQSKTGSSTYYVTQAANSVDSTTYGNVVITSPVSNSSLGPIAASGDSITPTLSAYQPITYTFTSNSTSAATSTTLTWSSNKSANASLGTGFYAISANGTVCAISAVTRGSTTGSVRTSNSITLTATGQGSKSTTTIYNAHQEANAMTVTYGDVNEGTNHFENNENIGTFNASGGTLWAYCEYSQRNISSYTSTYTAASYTNYSDYTVTSPANNASIGNGMYFVSATKNSDEIGFKFSADTRGTTTGTSRESQEFSITVKGLGNKSKTISGLTMSQAANAIVQYYCSDVGLYTDNIPFSGSSAGRSIEVAGITGPIAHPFLPVKPIYTSNATGTTISSTTHSISNLSLVTTHQSGAYLNTSVKKVYMTGSTSANTATTSVRNLLTIKGDVMYNNMRVVSSLTQTAYTSQFIAKQNGLPTEMTIYVVNDLNEYLTITGGTIAAYSGGPAKSFTSNTVFEGISTVYANLPTGVKLSGGTNYSQYGQFTICGATKTTIGLSANTKSNLPSSIYLVSSGGTVVTAGTLTRYTYVGSYYALYSGTSKASFNIPRYGYLIVRT